jgi:hypothetical protein
VWCLLGIVRHRLTVRIGDDGVWLKIVFTRHEVTRALSIEYGVLNTVAVLAGAILYRESEYMEDWQLAACFSLACPSSSLASASAR